MQRRKAFPSTASETLKLVTLRCGICSFGHLVIKSSTRQTSCDSTSFCLAGRQSSSRRTALALTWLLRQWTLLKTTSSCETATQHCHQS